MSHTTYPNHRYTRRVLDLAFPNSSEDLREELAYLVSVRRRTIDDAMDYLRKKEQERLQQQPQSNASAAAAQNGSTNDSTTPLGQRTSRAGSSNGDSEVGNNSSSGGSGAGTSSSSSSLAQTIATSLLRLRQKSAAVGSTAATTSRKSSGDSGGAGKGTAAARKKAASVSDETTRLRTDLVHYMYGDNATGFDKDILAQGGQVILFTTSLTGVRGTHEQTRSLQTLLYVKDIPYHYVDIADNAPLQRKLRMMYRDATGENVIPPLPILCVDRTVIGSASDVQELEDDGTLLEVLTEAGYRGATSDQQAAEETAAAGTGGGGGGDNSNDGNSAGGSNGSNSGGGSVDTKSTTSVRARVQSLSGTTQLPPMPHPSPSAASRVPTTTATATSSAGSSSGTPMKFARPPAQLPPARVHQLQRDADTSAAAAAAAVTAAAAAEADNNDAASFDNSQRSLSVMPGQHQWRTPFSSFCRRRSVTIVTDRASPSAPDEDEVQGALSEAGQPPPRQQHNNVPQDTTPTQPSPQAQQETQRRVSQKKSSNNSSSSSSNIVGNANSNVTHVPNLPAILPASSPTAPRRNSNAAAASPSAAAAAAAATKASSTSSTTTTRLSPSLHTSAARSTTSAAGTPTAADADVRHTRPLTSADVHPPPPPLSPSPPLRNDDKADLVSHDDDLIGVLHNDNMSPPLHLGDADADSTSAHMAFASNNIHADDDNNSSVMSYDSSIAYKSIGAADGAAAMPYDYS